MYTKKEYYFINGGKFKFIEFSAFCSCSYLVNFVLSVYEPYKWKHFSNYLFSNTYNIFRKDKIF